MGRILEHTDVLMTNYQEFRYERVLAAYPDTLIIGSEAVQYFRGEGNMLKAYQDLNPWFDVVNCKSVIGAFQWSAVSYLGESFGWPSRGWPGALILKWHVLSIGVKNRDSPHRLVKSSNLSSKHFF